MADERAPNKGGRPKVDEPGTRLSTYVRNSDYDRIVKLALKNDQSVASVVRDLLKLKLR